LEGYKVTIIALLAPPFVLAHLDKDLGAVTMVLIGLTSRVPYPPAPWERLASLSTQEKDIKSKKKVTFFHRDSGPFSSSH
jgi:hypothetical protein